MYLLVERASSPFFYFPFGEETGWKPVLLGDSEPSGMTYGFGL